MSATQMQRIQDNLSQLKLPRIGELLEDRLEQASKGSISYSEFLDQLLQEEVAAKNGEDHRHAHQHGKVPVF